MRRGGVPFLSRVAGRDSCRLTVFPDVAHAPGFFVFSPAMKAAKAKLRCGFLSDVFAGCSPQLEVNLRGTITETHTHARTRCV